MPNPKHRHSNLEEIKTSNWKAVTVPLQRVPMRAPTLMHRFVLSADITRREILSD